MITIVTWKWKNSMYRHNFTAEHVNILGSMLERNVTIPYRFLCITDDPKGIKYETYPLWDELREVTVTGWRERKPQCFVRLKSFAEEFRGVVGDRYASIDLDCVITGNIDHILSMEDDFVINRGGMVKNDYNGSFWMMDTGCRKHVYENFTPERAELASRQFMGSDQAFIRWILGKGETTIGKEDGIRSFLHTKRLQGGEKIIFFQGHHKPWHPQCQRIKWINENYK